ncbi:hypothetical protein [Streptomyces sp. NPDC002067]
MPIPGFTTPPAAGAGALSRRHGATAGSAVPHGSPQDAGRVIPQAYPPQCYGAQGFAKTSCYGVVLTCQDCCKQWNYQQSQYVDVCGNSYVCGACFGLPW